MPLICFAARVVVLWFRENYKACASSWGILPCNNDKWNFKGKSVIRIIRVFLLLLLYGGALECVCLFLVPCYLFYGLASQLRGSEVTRRYILLLSMVLK